MKLVLALAASAAAFGPVARLPAGRVGHVQTKAQQPAMLLGGLRARANNLVPARRPQNSARPGSLARETPQNPASLDPSMQVATKAESAEVSTTEKKGFLGGMDVPLLAYFFFWYLGNYYYNISNKTALKAAGGALGYPMTISTLQLGVGSLYALFLWAAPDARSFPKVNTCLLYTSPSPRD